MCSCCLSHGPACIAFHCSHLYITNRWSVAILPKHGCHFKQEVRTPCFKQLLIKAKVLNILIYCYYLLVRRSSMHLLSKFKLKSTISTPNNLLIVCHSSITNWSQNTFFRNGGNFPICGWYRSTLTLNSKRMFCDNS